MTHKIINKQCPESLWDKYTQRNEISRYNTRNNRDLDIPKYSVPRGLGTGVIRFVVAILAPRVQVPDLKGLGPSDRKTGGISLYTTLLPLIRKRTITNDMWCPLTTKHGYCSGVHSATQQVTRIRRPKTNATNYATG